MTDAEDLKTRIGALRAQLRSVHGLRGASLADLARRSGRVLPRRARTDLKRLAEAEPMFGHPKLEQQLDFAALRKGQERVSTLLSEVDLADRRKGALLSLAGAMAFNVIAVAVLFVVWMVWAGQL